MGFRHTTDRVLGVAIESVVLVLVVLSPWAFGAVEPLFEFFLYVGLAVLLVLWAGRVLCQRQFVWKKCPVALCLAAFFLLGIWQLQPLPRPVLNFLSPGAVRLYDELLPAEPELLPGGESYQRPALAAGNRISLYPGATRKELIRLLAVFLLFVVVRNNIASPASLRRLFLALVLNGCALAFFALIQFFTSPPPHNTVYWTYETKGSVFGPFISRTHYPFYLNICIGAGIGLLLTLGSADKRKKRLRRRDWEERPTGILHDPPRLWLSCALALMIGSVALSMSRGGFLALVSAAGVLLLLRRKHFARFGWAGAALLTVAAALMLVSWMGGQRVEKRLATIWSGEALQQSRMDLWRDSWPLVLEFPLVGTGYGTFSYAEPLHREHTASIFVHEHAHNEILEALAEGGVVRLAISLAAIGLMFRLGIRAVRRWEGSPAGGLALGALFGFTALVIHSLGDFGLHLPAIAFLAAVLCAQLAALGSDGTEPSLEPETGALEQLNEKAIEPAEQEPVERDAAEQVTEKPSVAFPRLQESRKNGETNPKGEAFGANAYVFRGWGAAPVVGALTLLVLALVLWTEGRRMERVQTYRLRAASLQGKTDPADRDRQLALRQAAAQLAPESGRVLAELAQTHLDRFEEQQAQLRRNQNAVTAAQLVGGGAWSWAAPLPGGWGQPTAGLAAWGWSVSTAGQQKRLVQEELIPGLRAYLQGRDVCPLLARPHIRLASNRPYLQKAEPRTAYLDRAKRLVTNDATDWFLFGVQEYLEGQKQRAALSWRRSLEISEEYLPNIQQLGKAGLGPKVLAEEVLPNRPELLLKAAVQLYPDPKDIAQRQPFLEKALGVLTAAPEPAKPADVFLKGQVLALLGRPAEAMAVFRLALAREPRQATWRVELAKLLRAQGQLRAAQRELFTVLQLQPDNLPANELLAAVNREMEKE